MGYILRQTKDGHVSSEADTTHCRHCQAVIDKNTWRENNGIWYCSKCNGPVCPHCSGIAKLNNYACDPWEAKIERQLKENAMIVRVK